MRNLVYNLANGTTVKTLAEAQASGLKYEPTLEKIKKPFKDTEGMKALRFQLWRL